MAAALVFTVALLAAFADAGPLAKVVPRAKVAPVALVCTPWSWRLCKAAGKGIYNVMVDAEGGGGMQAPVHYINGEFSLDMKLPEGYSGGVNFAWYLMDTISPDNKSPLHSEIDIEFYGGETSADVMLALNVFANGKQNLAQYKLPFDPTAALHTYTIRWAPDQITWLVDGVPLRILKKVAGEPWPVHAMKPMASVWATPWTKLKADYTNGPVTAQYGNYKAAGCLTIATAVQGAGCPGPWTAPLTPAQIAAYAKLNKGAELNNYGWDKA